MGGKKKEKIPKVILPPPLPLETVDDDVQVSDEDIDFVKSNRAYTGFLKNLDTNSITRYVNRVANQKEEELELLYERRNQKLLLQKRTEEEESFKVDPVDALPVKTLDGQLYFRAASGQSKQSGRALDELEQEDDNDDDNGKNKNVVKLTKVEKRAKLKKSRKEAKTQAKKKDEDQIQEMPQSEVLDEVRKELSGEEIFSEKKAKLAEIGTSVLENPEANVKSLKELLEICEDEDHKIVKLALLSMLTIFKDIIPGYRIRLPTQKEMQMKVSKDVKKLRFFEASLLSSYKVYLQKLKSVQNQPYYKHVVIRCMCNLLDAVPHFNFCESLLSGIVRNLGSDDDTIRTLCVTSLKSLFADEGKHGGEMTEKAVRLIADLVKIHNCHLYPDSIEVLLSLSFDEDLVRRKITEMEKKAKKAKNGRNLRQQDQDGLNKKSYNDRKKNRRELIEKTREEVEADLKSVTFDPDQEERCKIQSETLAAIFEIYFRVLKHSMETVTTRPQPATDSLVGHLGPRPLLSPCLKGLGKFAHLIDLDFMGDLMSALKYLAGSGYDQFSSTGDSCLNVSERLQCCIIAFRVMKNNLDALNVDLQDFFVQLYNLLFEYNPDKENRGEVIADALKVMLCEGKQHDMQRAAAFIKRLATFSLCFGSAEAMAALVTLRHLLQINIKCRNLLENDAGGGSLSGCVAKYQPDASDPNLSGALASVLWELSLISKHYHPAISSMASAISSMGTAHNQVYNSIVAPQQAFHDLSIECEPFNTRVKFASSDRKRKRGSAYSKLQPSIIQDVEHSLDEKEVEKKFSNHFMALTDILENEKLRKEIHCVESEISLYDEYKKQQKIKAATSKARRKGVSKS